MGDFVTIPFTLTESDFEDLALASYQASVPGFVPEDGDPEVIMWESFGPIAVRLGQILSNMPKAALIAFGQLLGSAYAGGQSAYTNVQFTFQDANGPYTIYAGAGLAIDGYGFVLTEDVVCPNGSTVATGLMASTDRTADANGLTGAQVTAQAMPGYVTGYTVLAATVGGQDPQTDDEYADQISRDRRLNNRAYVTPLDFELAALDVQGITRAHAEVTGTNALTLTVLGVAGAVATVAAKADVAALFTTATRMVNVTVTVSDPTFNTVSVTYQVQGESGFDPVDLVSRVSAALTTELEPLTHGSPESGDPGSAVTTWISDPYIYLNRMIAIAGDVDGVHRVVSMTLGGSQQAKLSAALTAGIAITSIPLSTTTGSNLQNTIPSGAVVTLTDTATGNTDTWTTSAQANPGAASIAVTSHAPVHAYPTATTTISVDKVTGDFQMSGTIPVPQPGTISGTAI